MRRLHADLLLLACAAIWGLAFVYQKTAMEHIGPYTFVAARATVAAIALAALAVRECRQSDTSLTRHFLGIALLGGCSFFTGAILQQIGLVTATVTNTGFLTALYVVFTPLIQWAVIRRAPRWFLWPAVVLSFLGTWLLGGGSLSAFSYGDLLVAISALFWAAHVVVVGQSSSHEKPVTFTAIQFAVVALLGASGAAAFETVDASSLRDAWKEIAYVGLLSSAITFTLLAVAMRYTTAGEASIIVSTEVLFAALGGALLLGERLPLVNWLGATLIVAAVLVVQLGPAMTRRRP